MNIYKPLRDTIGGVSHWTVEEKIRTINQTAWNLRKTDIPQALQLASESLDMSRTLLSSGVSDVSIQRELATALLILSTCDIRLSKYPAALDKVQEALRYFEEINDDYGRMHCLKNTATIQAKQGDFFGALALGSASLALAEQSGRSEDRGELLNLLGLLHWHTGKYNIALGYYLRSQEAFEEASDKQGASGVLNNLGLLYIELGAYDKALEYLLASLAIKSEIGDQASLGTTLSNIGNVFLYRKETAKALEYYLQGLELQKAMGDKQGEGTVMTNIAGVYLQLENPAKALEYCTACLQLAREIGDRRIESYALAEIGAAYELQDRMEEAREAYEKSHDIRREIGYRKGVMEALFCLGNLLFRQQQYEEAGVWLNESLAVAEELQSKNQMYEIHEHLATLHEYRNDIPQALFHYKQFHRLHSEVFNEQSDQRLTNLQVVYKVEQATKEAEIYRLKNVELASANAEVLRHKENLEEQARRIEEANTELQEKNKALYRLNQEKDEFLGVAAHGLKNPLSGIVMTASMLKSYFDTVSREELYSGLERIESTARRMEDIITKLLSINAFESGQMKLHPVPLDLAPLVMLIVREYEERAAVKNIQLVTEYDESSDIVAFADVMMTREIIDNLVSNAIKFSPYGTTVCIRTSISEILRSDYPFHEAHTAETYFTQGIRIEVQDEGPGINDDDGKRLFGKFERLSAKPTGGEHSTGLGLSIVRKLAEVMGGRVWYECRQQRGTTFIVELPAVGWRQVNG